MKPKRDQALTLSNPRLLAAVYFGVLAIVVTIVFDALFDAIGIEQILPLSKAIVLSVIIAAVFGALFGERIIHSKQPYRKHVFFLAFMMVLCALPVYNFGLVYLLKETHHDLFMHANFSHLLYLYLFVLLYSFILAGIWLAIVAGFAALYLRGRVVYYLLQTQDEKPRHLKEAKIDSEKKHISVDDTH